MFQSKSDEIKDYKLYLNIINTSTITLWKKKVNLNKIKQTVFYLEQLDISNYSALKLSQNKLRILLKVHNFFLGSRCDLIDDHLF